VNAERQETVMSERTVEPNSLSLAFVEGLYTEFLRDPGSVDAQWRRYFESWSREDEPRSSPELGPSFRPASLFRPPRDGGGTGSGNGGGTAAPARILDVAALQDRVDQLIRAYRVRGHMIAQLDPLGLPRPPHPELDPEFYGFTEADLDRPFSTATIQGPQVQTLRQILQRLRNTYCRWIGVQFMHIDDLGVKRWLQTRMEGSENHIELSREEQLRILTRLTDAVIFEEFIQKKYIGAKSFSLEGGESLIPLLDLMIEKAGEHRLDEIVLAMAHRGRLNVLANIMRKSPWAIFREFEDTDPELHLGRGDVKYHLGYSTDWKTAAGHKVHLSLCFNPSHLEYVNPVALGRMRAKQDRVGDLARERGMVILIHGDAAFAAEGVVQETLNLSELKAYSVGGTIHIIVNNQIGFTTGPAEARSSPYATDVAKMLQVPIFHVNGEDPEAVAQVVRLSMDFRREFKGDVVIDMYCYRRRGHNESDEPAFTHPLMYRAIAQRKSVREGYLEHLLKLGGVTREKADEIAVRRREHLERELEVARSEDRIMGPDTLSGVWSAYRGGSETEVPEVDTGVDPEILSRLLEAQTRVPAGFQPHPKIQRILEQRRRMAKGEVPLDWAAAEALAFATLASEGHRVRLSGQDCERGTFSHRHAVLHDVQDGKTYTPLLHLAPDQARVEIYNSPLSEIGVLGFEYGYSLDCPDGLVLWEAQFGDFWNCAQVIVDQFLASAEDKWRRLSGLVLLLPHGFEGAGPEHSSARLERFLSLAAGDNIQVAYPTAPAQLFHLLRRQVKRRWRKPLIVMTPKSLLRLPEAVSTLQELSEGRFRRILPDSRERKGQFSRVLLCSGKIYYELAKHRETLGRDDVAIFRMEQLYPLRERSLQLNLTSVADGTPVLWVQEEPENMGAWKYLKARFGAKLLGRLPLHGVYRPESATPATGSSASHKLEQAQILDQAFARL
jgi:2-oxoglutarate dehydrogenase E1 component